jgi:pimeloyl-ACP methyl ester carboxylesterase
MITCDHLGVGDSSIPGEALNLADLAMANATAATQLLRELRKGVLSSALPPLPGLVALGIGHSYGGLLLTILQARSRVFDGIGLLGWSGVNTVIPCDPAHPRLGDVHTKRVPGLEHPYRSAFHWDDVPEAIVAEDLEGYPHRLDGSPVPFWACRYMPGGPNGNPEQPPRGAVVAHEAAQIDVPVLVAVGERDVSPDPWAEPGAYRSSTDITLYVAPAMAHAHNFAGTRELLWDRIAAWAKQVPIRKSD